MIGIGALRGAAPQPREIAQQQRSQKECAPPHHPDWRSAPRPWCAADPRERVHHSQAGFDETPNPKVLRYSNGLQGLALE